MLFIKIKKFHFVDVFTQAVVNHEAPLHGFQEESSLKEEVHFLGSIRGRK